MFGCWFFIQFCLAHGLYDSSTKGITKNINNGSYTIPVKIVKKIIDILERKLAPIPDESENYIYKIQSTAKINETSSGGSPTVSKTITRVTRPACGIPAAPILAAVDVILKMEFNFVKTKLMGVKVISFGGNVHYLTATIFPNDNEMPRNCAINIAATASYNAVPSMLIVAPIGSINRDIVGLTLFFSSKQLIVTGNVAELIQFNILYSKPLVK